MTVARHSSSEYVELKSGLYIYITLFCKREKLENATCNIARDSESITYTHRLLSV